MFNEQEKRMYTEQEVKMDTARLNGLLDQVHFELSENFGPKGINQFAIMMIEKILSDSQKQIEEAQMILEQNRNQSKSLLEKLEEINRHSLILK